MKKIFLSFCFIIAALLTANGQDKKAEREAAAQAAFEKALATIETKNYVIIVATFQDANGVDVDNTDNANFLAFENENVILQGGIVAGNNHTNKLAVSNYDQITDKKGNVRITYQAMGRMINAKITMSIKKSSGDMAEVIITPTKGTVKRFTGRIVPTAESRHYRRPGEI
ncbi:MAG TPA: DUF4251 domain-containing protein [Bacteroidales bacterium]|nr:DUF4251 domain-containing protein [Bacteroidales bacterium]